MPGGDGTGPMGMGAMTGRAAGLCVGYPSPGYANNVPVGRGSRGLGRGFRGGGRRYGSYAAGLPGWARTAQGWPVAVGPETPYTQPPDAQQMLEGLKAQASHLENSLDDIRQRIEGLESQHADQSGKG